MAAKTNAPTRGERPHLVSTFGKQGHLSAAIGPISEMEDLLEGARCACLTLDFAGQAMDGQAADIVCHMARQIGDLIEKVSQLRGEAWDANKQALEG